MNNIKNMLVKCQLENGSKETFSGKIIEVTIKPNNIIPTNAISWCKIKSPGDNYVANTYFGSKIITIKRTLF